MTRIFPNSEALAQAAAQSFAELAKKAIQARGVFYVALAGGSTPKVIYQALAQMPLPWEQIHLFWGDERLVLNTDPRSNYHMVQKALLEKINIPPENVHQVKVRLELNPEETFNVLMSDYFLTQDDPDGFAYSNKPLVFPEDARYGQYDPVHPYTDHIFEQILSAYQSELESVQFDLVHLGLGTDGHMASLFPASNLESDALAQLTFPTSGLEPQVQRISLSLGCINAARVKQFFVTGSSKQDIVAKIKAGQNYPATRVTNPEWWLDETALP